jgi:hypothetical protein
VRKSELIQGNKIGRERPKLTLIVVVRNDMSIKQVIESVISDRIE